MDDGDRPRVLRWTWSDRTDVRDLWELIRGPADAVVVTMATLDAPIGVDRMVELLEEPLAASVSPLPSGEASADRVDRYELAPALPPPPTVLLPSERYAVFSVPILRAVWTVPPRPDEPWSAVVTQLGQRMVDHGWRHLACPGFALNWAPDTSRLVSRSAWTPRSVRALDGGANESLATHRLWASTRRRVKLVLDAPCLDGDPHNGTQALVSNLAVALAGARPEAEVALAVRPRNLDVVRETTGERIEVHPRGRHLDTDVVYRPYQLLTPAELPWLVRTGRRLMLGQLDMIGFANPSYHPSPALLHTVRNLQRQSMRIADGVTFISDFARRHALVECPDLEIERCHVVGSGAARNQRGSADPPVDGSRFVLCLSASFWHKHREHAIRTFAALATDHGYPGDLWIAGPEPHHGSSLAAERALVASLPAPLRTRVRHLGRVDDATKWTLLERADLLLYPSVVEGFGMVPFEAASVGTPSLVAAGSALGEVFDATGAVVASWDEREWAERADRLVTDERDRVDLVDQLIERADRYSWSAVAAATWRVVDDVLARPRARLHVDEGGRRSRVAAPDVLAASAIGVHFANRVVAAVGRRVARSARRPARRVGEGSDR